MRHLLLAVFLCVFFMCFPWVCCWTGKAFAAFKASAKTRQDVFDKVQKYAETPAAAALGQYEAHFVQALVSDFKRGGLALDDTQRTELQR